MYAVILAGGGGTRLWPLSRRARPKPFLPLLGPVTLFRGTVERIAPLVGWDGVYVIAERQHADLVAAQAPELPDGHLLCEPEGRNTAAAIAYGALAVHRAPGEVMVVLPADHAIRDEGTFRSVLHVAGERLATGAFGVADPLVTLGIRPSGPETGYGYIRPHSAAGGDIGGLTAYPVEAFEEKPTAARAGELVAMPGVSWNAGMFLWRRRAILDALGRYAPDVLTGVREALAAGGPGTPLATDAAAGRYRSVRAISIDYAVMEPAGRDGRVLMGAMDVGWNDVGSWSAVLDVLLGDGGQVEADDEQRSDVVDVAAGETPGDHEDLGSHRVLVAAAGGRLVVTIGLRDTIVVDTSDAMLVCAADRAQEVRAIVDRLRAAREADLL